jgi:hypothetical protein
MNNKLNFFPTPDKMFHKINIYKQGIIRYIIFSSNNWYLSIGYIYILLSLYWEKETILSVRNFQMCEQIRCKNELAIKRAVQEKVPPAPE